MASFRPVLRVPQLAALSILITCLSSATEASTGAVHAHLTPLAMFLGADVVVKGIMIGLAAASVLTWTIAIGKSIEVGMARRRVRKGIAALSEFKTLSDAQLARTVPAGLPGRLTREAIAEIAFSAQGSARESIEARIASRLADIEEQAGRDIKSGTGLLATVGSTAPFVGLLGTVWGIMNSFIGIAASNTTNLAVVAPGIAEALLATAIGLVAAIPAVVVYNVLARKISTYRALVRRCSSEITRMASRDLDRGLAGARKLQVAAE